MGKARTVESAASAKKETLGGRMSFFQHLAELRRRLIACIIVVFVAMLGCLALAPELFIILQSPLSKVPHHQLIVLSPIEL